MTLHGAISKILNGDNSNELSPIQIYNMLSDFGVFSDFPLLKLATKSALEFGLWQLVTSRFENSESDRIRLKLINSGFSDNVADSIITSVHIVQEDIRHHIIVDERLVDGVCLRNNQQGWCYETQAGVSLTPAYVGISVITADGLYAASSSLRPFNRDYDEDTQIGAKRWEYDKVGDVIPSHPIHPGCEPVNVARVFVCMIDGKVFPLSRKDSTTCNSTVQTGNMVPDKWRLYNFDNKPLSKEYSEIFLCYSTVNIKNRHHTLSQYYAKFQKEGFLLVKNGYKSGKPAYGIITLSGQEVVPTQYSRIEITDVGFTLAYPGNIHILPYCVFSDRCGNELERIYDCEWVSKVQDGYLFKKNDSLGMLNNDKKEIIPPKYTMLKPINCNLLRAKKLQDSSSWQSLEGVIDFNNNIIIPFEYNRILVKESAELFICYGEDYICIYNSKLMKIFRINFKCNYLGGYILPDTIGGVNTIIKNGIKYFPLKFRSADCKIWFMIVSNDNIFIEFQEGNLVMNGHSGYAYTKERIRYEIEIP